MLVAAAVGVITTVTPVRVRVGAAVAAEVNG
jgi:hypothetical protein